MPSRFSNRLPSPSVPTNVPSAGRVISDPIESHFARQWSWMALYPASSNEFSQTRECLDQLSMTCGMVNSIQPSSCSHVRDGSEPDSTDSGLTNGIDIPTTIQSGIVSGSVVDALNCSSPQYARVYFELRGPYEMNSKLGGPRAPRLSAAESIRA